MSKTILITGSTDGIGLETARALVGRGHVVILHGRDADKLDRTARDVADASAIERHVADLSRLEEVAAMAAAVSENHDRLDVLVNNAGVFRASQPVVAGNHDIRFVVNAFAPWLLTQRLLPSMDASGRVVNLSSAAQASVSLDALIGRKPPRDEMAAYAQSKLALTMWSRVLADRIGGKGPSIVAVNPGSLLATKMVREGFGTAGSDVAQGVDILCRAALDEEFSEASGRYFDNDAGCFADPHPDALDDRLCAEVTSAIEATVAALLPRDAA